MGEHSQKNNELTILSYGDNPLVSTGYGQVWNNLLKRWTKQKPKWKFYHLGWQSRDRAHETKEGFIQLPMGKLEYGYDTVVTNIMKYNPDFFITLCDVGWQSGFIKSVYEAKRRGWKGKWIAYTPIDTHSWAMTWDEIFQSPDINVAMSQWGEAMMKKHNVPNVTMIPHGVDTKVFYPLSIREQLREKYKVNDKFVVGFVGRNQRRKMIANLIKGFSNFAKNKDDVLLLLHTDQEPAKAKQNVETAFVGWSLPYLQDKFKIEDKLKLSKTNLDIDTRQKIAPQNMNEIYNLMDIFCYATGGEGFGLPAIECQSAGVPLLMTSCTTAFELCRKHNLIPVLVDCYGRAVVDIGTNGVEFVYPDDIKIAELLEKYYNDWKGKKELLKKESEDARKFSLKYDWDIISKRWINLFENEKYW